MKDFLFKVTLFSFISLGIYIFVTIYILPIGIGKEKGPNTHDQIAKSFNDVQREKYDLIILGNSSSYRGINPDLIDMSAYNFSHDNDSYNQMYHKLLFLDRQNIHPKFLILSINYSSFSYISDSRNYIYNSFFEDSYKKDFPEGNIFNQFISETGIDKPYRLKYLLNIFSSKK